LSDPDAIYCETALKVISGQPSAITIAYPSPSMEIGGSARFAAIATDVNGNIIESAKMIWSVQGGIGNITKDGIFTASKAGNGKIKAEAYCPLMPSDCPSASIGVTVNDKPALPITKEKRTIENETKPQATGSQGERLNSQPLGQANQTATKAQQTGQATQLNISNSPQGAPNEPLAIGPLIAIGTIVVAAALAVSGAFFVLRKREN